MASQPSFFIETAAPDHRAKRCLVLRAQPGRTLDKRQRAFNRLIARIENLRTTLDAEKRRLDDLLVFHAQHVRPRVERAIAMRKDVARALRPFLDDRRLKRGDRRELRNLIAEQLDDVVQTGGVLEDDLGALFEQLHGASREEFEQKEMEDARSAMEDMFANVGLDIDLSDLHPGMSEEEVAVKLAAMAEQVRQQTEDARSRDRAHRHRSKREREAHDKAARNEALRKASIGTIYRRLARVLHPDLEMDPERRQQKGALMQELTSAYANNDLHTLLRLELEWIYREEAHRVRATDEKLEAYLAILKNQVVELESEISELPCHPRYTPLICQAGFGFGLVMNGAMEVRRLDGLIASLRQSLARLQTADALDEVRDAVRAHRRTCPF